MQGKRTCEAETCGILAVTREEYQEQVFSSGMEHPGAAGSGEVKTCGGGDVVEAGAEAILNTLGPIGLLIYPLGLEE